MRFRFIPLLVAPLVLLAGACSNSPDTEDFVESLAEQPPFLAEDDALCVVEQLQKDVTNSELEILLSADNPVSVAGSDVDSATFEELQFAAVRACGLNDQVSPKLAEAFATANSIPVSAAECAVSELEKEFGFWDLADRLADDAPNSQFERSQFEAIFGCGERTAVAEQLQPQLAGQGVAAGDASCVAEAISVTMEVEDLSVLFTGEMTDRFFTLYFEALESCDALPDDG